MDIHHFVGKKAHTETCWVYTQKGYEESKESPYLTPNDLELRKPGMPVGEYYRQSCPMWWVYNGWVTEAEGQLTLF